MKLKLFFKSLLKVLSYMAFAAIVIAIFCTMVFLLKAVPAVALIGILIGIIFGFAFHDYEEKREKLKEYQKDADEILWTIAFHENYIKDLEKQEGYHQTEINYHKNCIEYEKADFLKLREQAQKIGGDIDGEVK
jgi:predicted membrane protein